MLESKQLSKLSVFDKNTWNHTTACNFLVLVRNTLYYISKVQLATIVEGDLKAPFSIATTPRCRGRRYSFPRLLHFTLDPYLIMLRVKQGGIKYHFLSLWYDLTWDWTQVSQAIGEYSNRYITACKQMIIIEYELLLKTI